MSSRPELLHSLPEPNMIWRDCTLQEEVIWLKRSSMRSNASKNWFTSWDLIRALLLRYNTATKLNCVWLNMKGDWLKNWEELKDSKSSIWKVLLFIRIQNCKQFSCHVINIKLFNSKKCCIIFIFFLSIPCLSDIEISLIDNNNDF